MKENIFNQYVEKITKLFGITKEELFSKTKKREVVDARQLLTYLCYNRQIKFVTIKSFMDKNGYKVSHQNLLYNTRNIQDKVSEDRDYVTIISKIDNSVFI